MARHRLIAELHGLHYDLLTADEDVRVIRAAYDAKFRQCCEVFACAPDNLWSALHGDFSKWMRDEGLPKPPPQN